jgi:hypothetical protein
VPLYSAVYVPFVSPGQSFTCFDGTETPGASVKSAAFMRGHGALGLGWTAPVTFSIDFSTSPTAVVLIQASNTNVDADFQTVKTSTDTQYDNYSDSTTAWKFYRAVLSTYSSGGMPVVTAQR